MITRRDFMTTSAASVPAALANEASGSTDHRVPLKAEPRFRTLVPRSQEDGELLLVSDGPSSPQRLIKPEALERVFGPGTESILQQPDHWRMIEAGWFEGDDLYLPTDHEDPAWWVWQSTYRPEVEAHDLLCAVFTDQFSNPIGNYIAEIGLELAEHPSSPRYATAKLRDTIYLPRLKAALSARSHWVEVNENCLPEEAI